MGHIYLSHWIWDESAPGIIGGCWKIPGQSNLKKSIDIRSNAQCAQKSGNPGPGIFIYDQKVDIPGVYLGNETKAVLDDDLKSKISSILSEKKEDIADTPDGLVQSIVENLDKSNEVLKIRWPL